MPGAQQPFRLSAKRTTYGATESNVRYIEVSVGIQITDWMVRQMLYTGTAPRDNDSLWIANTHAEIADAIPDTGHSRRLPSVIPAPIALDPGGRASMMPRGQPGADAEPAAFLHRKMPRVPLW